MPYCMSHNQCLKCWTNWAAKFCLIRRIHLISCQPTTTSSVSRQFFAGKTLPQPPGCWKCFSRCFVESQSMDIYIIGIKLISHWQKLLIVIIPTLINKDVFEPSYNDLKFMVHDHSYDCINHIYTYKWVYIYIYTMEYYSAVKKNSFESVLMR